MNPATDIARVIWTIRSLVLFRVTGKAQYRSNHMKEMPRHTKETPKVADASPSVKLPRMMSGVRSDSPMIGTRYSLEFRSMRSLASCC